jgi:hypothetical protein
MEERIVGSSICFFNDFSILKLSDSYLFVVVLIARFIKIYRGTVQ